MPIKWESNMQVGHPTIDGDHMQLIELINLVGSAVEGRNPELADQIMFALLAYVTGHFSREEALLESIGFPEIDNHKRRHEIMADFADTLNGQIKAGLPADKRLEHLTQLHVALRDWLPNHILKEDHKMIPYLNAGKPAAVPLV